MRVCGFKNYPGTNHRYLERPPLEAKKEAVGATPLEVDGEKLEMVGWYSLMTSYNLLDLLLFLKIFLGMQHSAFSSALPLLCFHYVSSVVFVTAGRFDIRAQQAATGWGRDKSKTAAQPVDPDKVVAPFYYDFRDRETRTGDFW